MNRAAEDRRDATEREAPTPRSFTGVFGVQPIPPSLPSEYVEAAIAHVAAQAGRTPEEMGEFARRAINAYRAAAAKEGSPRP